MKREIAQWVHPMKDRSDDPSHHERTLLPRSYISLTVGGNYYRLILSNKNKVSMWCDRPIHIIFNQDIQTHMYITDPASDATLSVLVCD